MTKPRTRLEAKQRHLDLLKHAIHIAAEVGYDHVTRPQIAEAAGVTPALVSYHFGTMAEFRRALMRHAVIQAPDNANARRVVLQGIMAKDKHASKCSAAIREQAMAEMSV
jgi:AcrR family transcriptional regulator